MSKGLCAYCGWPLDLVDREVEHACDPEELLERGAAAALGILGMAFALSEAIENRCWTCKGILGCLPTCRYYGPWSCERNGHIWAHSSVCQECGFSDDEDDATPIRGGAEKERR